jgi:hypothetical protein
MTFSLNKASDVSIFLINVEEVWEYLKENRIICQNLVTKVYIYGGGTSNATK